MLARLVSETRQKDPEEEIFVERDGLRFRCVLNYMRNQQVRKCENRITHDHNREPERERERKWLEGLGLTSEFLID